MSKAHVQKCVWHFGKPLAYLHVSNKSRAYQIQDYSCCINPSQLALPGPSRSVYVVSGLVDSVNAATHEVIPGTLRNTPCNDCMGMLPRQPLQHGNKPTCDAKEVPEQFKEYFCVEGAVLW